MIEDMYKLSEQNAKIRVWILSDLQQQNSKDTENCLNICISDFNKLGNPADAIWYLGDAVEGNDLIQTKKLATMQVEAFKRFNIPLCFTLGNHDLQYTRNVEKDKKTTNIPFWEEVKKVDGWHTTNSFEDWYFKVTFGDYTVYFFSDHISKDKNWICTHGNINDRGNKYPHWNEIETLRNEISNEKGPIITASHYSFAGGNRSSDFMSRLLPLSDNVKIHFYGHAHIGDYEWAGKNACRRISWVDWHDIPQINVSSFENIRGDFCRSVFLHIYEDNTMGIFFRNHDEGKFIECYFPSEYKYASNVKNVNF